MNDLSKKTYVHLVRERYCKGCDICVHFCPKGVLALQSGKAVAVRPELCVGCRMCELRCPDFAIEVRELGEEEAATPGPEPDFGLPPEAMHD